MSYKVKLNAISIITLDILGRVPLYNPLIPWVFQIAYIHSIEFLHLDLDWILCMFVLTTSNGVFTFLFFNIWLCKINMKYNHI